MRLKKIKWSSTILLTLIALLTIGLFPSNLILKNAYNKVDKSDNYWNYNKILDQPFKHLKIEGGNITRIIFEPSKHASVRVLNNWGGYQKDSTLSAYVKNDTLYIKFTNKFKNLGEKSFMKYNVLLRLFAPQLLSVEGSDTNFELQKMKQKSISINLKGKSSLEVETYQHNFDSLHVTQRDSSQVVFEMSPEIKGSETMSFANVDADLKGYSLLDIGHGFANNLKLNIADSSAIILSGKSLKGFSKQGRL